MLLKMVDIGYGHYKISDADAGKLAKEAGKTLPKHGYQLTVSLPDGEIVHLLRTPYSANGHKDAPKRGWVWAVHRINKRHF